MFQAVIGLGSNLGDGTRLLLSAWESLAQTPNVRGVRLSSLFQSDALGMVSQRLFTNGIGLVRTALTPLDLLHRLMEIETEHGRRRDPGISGYQDRFLDLDLLYFEETVCQTPELVLPHRAVAGRMFVLAPLLEVAPDLVDPVSGASVSQMYHALSRQMALGELPMQTVTRMP